MVNRGLDYVNSDSLYFDIAGVMLLVLDSDRKIKKINKKGCEILEASHKKLIGKEWLNFVPPEMQYKVKQVFKSIISGKIKSFDKYENEVITFKGKRKLLRWTNKILKNSSGKIIGTLSSGEDITLENQSRQSEERFHSLLNTTSEMIVLHEIIYDLNGNAIDYKIVDCNPAFTKITGILKQRAVGKIASKLYKTKKAPYLEIYSNVAKTGISVSFETYFAPMKKFFSVSVFSQIKGTFATVTSDITEKKETEQRLLKEKEKMQTILDNTQAGIALVDFYHHFIDANPAFCKILGYSLNELKKMTFRDFTYKEDLVESKKNVSELMSGKIDSFILEKRYIRKDKKMIFCRVKLTSIKDKDDKFLYNIVSLDDINEAKKAEQKMKEQMNLLQRFKDSTVDQVLRLKGIEEENKRLREK